jgi:hypothetical protein
MQTCFGSSKGVQKRFVRSRCIGTLTKTPQRLTAFEGFQPLIALNIFRQAASPGLSGKKQLKKKPANFRPKWWQPKLLKNEGGYRVFAMPPVRLEMVKISIAHEQLKVGG